MTLDEAKTRAKMNKLAYGGDWQVLMKGKRLWINMVGTFKPPGRSKVVFKTGEDNGTTNSQ